MSAKLSPACAILTLAACLISGCDAEIYNVRRPLVRIYNEEAPPPHVYVPARPPAPRVTEIEAPAGHTWVYYPEVDVYHCTSRNFYVVHRGGQWVTMTSGVECRGPTVAVEYNGPRPYLYVEVHRRRHRGTTVRLGAHERPAGHTWVYYPDVNVYHCKSQNFYYHHVGGQWVRTTSVHVHGPPVVVEYNGPQPFLHVEIHRRRRRR